MNKSQEKYLREQAMAVSRVAGQRINRQRYNSTNGEGKDPPDVAKARKVITAHETKVVKAAEASRGKLALAYSKVEEAILFGDEAVALAELKKFKATWAPE